MKPVISRVTCIAALFFVLCVSASAAAKFEPDPTAKPFPSEVKPGDTLSFSLKYTGDPPKTLNLVVNTPDGATVTIPSKPEGDPTAGAFVTWQYTPQSSGNYRYYFLADTGDLGKVRYPENPVDDPQFVSVSLVTKYIIFFVGMLIALAFLPFVVYVASRSANKRGDPAAAARIAILIGVLASYGLYLYLFSFYGVLMSIIGAVVALALIIVLLTRRTTAR